MARWARPAAGGILLALALSVPHLFSADRLVGVVGGTSFVVGFERPATALDVIVASGDGQAYAGLARDPTLARPEAFRDGPAEAARRAQRPLLSYLAWIGSGGDPDVVPMALFVLAILAAGLASAAATPLLRERGVNPMFAPLVFVLPGSIASFSYFGPELLALGICLLGFIAWERERVWSAVVAFTLAGLARDTFLLVPVVLFLCRRRDARLLIPPAVWLGWTMLVLWRFGTWGPTAPEPDGHPMFGVPFAGIIQALGHLREVSTIPVIALTVSLAIFAIVRGRPGPVRWVVIAYTAMALCIAEVVWLSWTFFARPLLPLTAFTVLCILERRRPAMAGVP